jgi:hypothetical protein
MLIFELEWERIDLSSARMAVYSTPIELEASAEGGHRLVLKRKNGAAWGEGPHGVRDRRQAGRGEGIPHPRPQTHGGQPHGDARRHVEGSAGDPRAQDVLASPERADGT